MKVCYVLAHFYPHVGGAEKAMLDYILSVKNLGVEVRVITSTSGGETGKTNYQGIDIYHYDWKIFFGHPMVKKEDIIEHVEWADIVHTAVYSPVITTSSVCKKLDKPLIMTVFESLNEKWFWIESNKIKALMFRTYERMVLKSKCAYYHTISTATTNDLKKQVSAEKIKEIYSIVELNKENIKPDREKFNSFFEIDSKDIAFLSYGRPGKTKGIFVYLDAIKKVVEMVPKNKLENVKFCFIMANDPLDQKQKFLKLREEYNLEKYIIVKDSVSREDLDVYIKSSDYVVVPSITEGFGLTAAEACEMGKKLIYSSAGSLPEVTFGQVMEFENKNSDSLYKILRNVILGKAKFKTKPKKDFSSKTAGKNMYELYKKAIKRK